MNYGTKKVLGYVVKFGHINSDDVYAVLDLCKETHKKTPGYFRVDQAKIFSSKNLLDFYESHNIIYSPYKGRLNNQPIENFHGRLKSCLTQYFLIAMGMGVKQ